MKESKFNLISSVLALTLGAVIAFVIADIFLEKPKDITIKTIAEPISKDVSVPDNEVFNAKSIDPTVEVYIGGEGD